MSQKRSGLPLIIALSFSFVVTTLLCTPGTEFPKIGWKDKVFLDKWIHAGLFALLVISWCWAYMKKKDSGHKHIFLKIALLVFAYGVITEIIQEYLVPFRSLEIPDIIADGVGAFLGYFIALKKYIKNKHCLTA